MCDQWWNFEGWTLDLSGLEPETIKWDKTRNNQNHMDVGRNSEGWGIQIRMGLGAAAGKELWRIWNIECLPICF